MFKAVPMQHAAIQVLREDAPKTALLLARTRFFDPEPNPSLARHLPESPSEHFRETYRSAITRLDKILSCCGRIEERPLDYDRVIGEAELEQANDRLGVLWRELSELHEGLHRLAEERKGALQLLETLDKFSSLDIDLGLLQGRRRFLDVHIGTVPKPNRERLAKACELAGYFLNTFLEVEDTDYIVITGPLGRQEEELHRLLEAAGFRPVTVPVEFKDHPEKVREGLDGRIRRIDREADGYRQAMSSRATKYSDELTRLTETVSLAAPYADLTEALRGRGGLVQMTGWVPQSEIPGLRRQLEESLSHPFVLQARDPFPEERDHVPSFIRHPRLLQPFAELVRNYGVPGYGEFDPTFLFAVTFVAMFGMMFGDVGHGLVFVAAGFLLPRFARRFRPCVVGAGLTSVLFGFLYGSVFGYEHWIEPVWVSPLSDPMLMLTVALYWGIGFILVASALTVLNRLAQGDYAEAVFGGNGLAGILLYAAGLYIGARWFRGDPLTWVHGMMFGAPLAVVLIHAWRVERAALGERALVVFIEGFETLLGYVANTLSFLRVAAFSLNHVALAIAVFTLADMLGTVGQWVVVVLGNIFIIVLEGAIVAIQVLRLEYYEGFSRFFGGHGREFCPLSVSARRGGKSGARM